MNGDNKPFPFQWHEKQRRIDKLSDILVRKVRITFDLKFKQILAHLKLRYIHTIFSFFGIYVQLNGKKSLNHVNIVIIFIFQDFPLLSDANSIVNIHNKDKKKLNGTVKVKRVYFKNSMFPYFYFSKENNEKHEKARKSGQKAKDSQKILKYFLIKFSFQRLSSAPAKEKFDPNHIRSFEKSCSGERNFM